MVPKYRPYPSPFSLTGAIHSSAGARLIRLTLKRSVSRPSGEWNDDDFDVLATASWSAASSTRGGFWGRSGNLVPDRF
jgi:hypothetical protein